MTAPILHIDELEFTRDLRHGEKFEAKLAPVAPRLGARKLGYNVTTVPPGKRAFPFHNHHANEEMFFVLEGEGTVSLDGVDHAVRKGSLVHIPPGVVHGAKGRMRVLVVGIPDISDEDLFFPES